jgi:hypothetical protein
MIPLELVTMLGSTLLGGVMQIWSQSLKAKQQAQAALMERAGLAAEHRTQLLNNSNPSVMWTRRVIALSVVFSVMVLPKVAVLLFPTLPVSYGWTTTAEGFLWGIFGSGQEILQWHEVRGIAITPLDTHFTASIAGLYFGGSLVRQ